MQRTEMSLSALVAGSSAIVIAIAMSAYAAVEHVFRPGAAIDTLVLTHAWHVIGLATLTYVVVWWVVRRVVASPIRSIDAHLYGVAVGRLDPLEVSSRVREIGRLLSSVNLMLRRMSLSTEADGLGAARNEVRAIRALLPTLYAVAPEDAELLLGHLARLDAALTRTHAELGEMRASQRPPPMVPDAT